MISLRRLYLALVIFVLLWSGRPECFGQDVVGYTAVLQSTNSSEIDGYSLTETSYAVADYYDAGVIGYLFDGASQVDAEPGEGNVTAVAYPTSTSVHLGDTYTLYSEHYLIAVYYTSGVGFYNPDDYYPGTGFAPGDEGYAPGYSFTSGGGPGVVQQQDLYLGYTYLQFSPVPPQVSSITPAYVSPGDSGTFNLNGSNLQDDFGVFNVRPLDRDNISVASSDQSSASLSYSIAAGATVGTHRFTVSNTWGESEPVSFTVNSSAQFNAQHNACPAGLDATSGFSSITPSGLTTGGSGSMAVSFGQGSFNGFGITVPYGPNSTPESIASHLAALITKRYASSGLTAQAYGASILYKGNVILGAVNFTSSGSSSDSAFAAVAAPQSCPPANLKYILVVNNDSVEWKPVEGSAGQRGRQITYQIANWPSATQTGYRSLTFPTYTTAYIKEHLTKNGYTSDNYASDLLDEHQGIFEDVLGTGSLTNSFTGIFISERWFSVSLDGVPVPGSIMTFDKAGKHQTDHIEIHLPTGPSILNYYPTPNGPPADISLPNY